MVKRGFPWKHTKSCPLDGRSMKHKEQGITHCGICSSCLLRRISLHEADIAKNEEAYYWDITSSDKLLVNTKHKLTPSPNPDIYGMAFHAIESMERMANLLKNRNGIRMVKQQAFFLAANLGQSSQYYEEKLVDLISKHKIEWDSYLESINKESWLYSVMRALR